MQSASILSNEQIASGLPDDASDPYSSVSAAAAPDDSKRNVPPPRSSFAAVNRNRCSRRPAARPRKVSEVDDDERGVLSGEFSPKGNETDGRDAVSEARSRRGRGRRRRRRNAARPPPPPPVLADLYRSRLLLPPDLPLPPTIETLRLLTEAHLRHVPFENVSMHTPRRLGGGGGSGWVRDGNDDDDDDDDDEEKKAEYLEREDASNVECGRDDDEDSSDPDDSGEPAVVLDLPRLIEKILRRNRGGCCLELNGLFGAFLRSLGYSVRFVPCWVYAGRERGHSGGRAKFRAVQTHFWLLVGGVVGDSDDDAGVGDDDAGVGVGGGTTAVDAGVGGGTTAVDASSGGGGGRQYLVDVGLGEPPLGPLEYRTGAVGVEQRTPDGMRSRIAREAKEWIDGKGRVRRCLHLEWLRRSDANGRGSEGDEEVEEDGRRSGDGGGAMTSEARKLRAVADRLRAVADRARRKWQKARPRTAIQVFKSDPDVREEAMQRLRQSRCEEKCKNGHVGAANGTAPERADVHKEVCRMWSALSKERRQSYAHRGENAVDDLQRAAEKAEAESRVAERAARYAEEKSASTIEVGVHRATDSDVLKCDDDDDSASGDFHWEPRLQWDVSDAPLSPSSLMPLHPGNWKGRDGGPPLESFRHAASIITSDRSTFAKKVIACTLTREAKVTLSGRTLRVTSPRFVDPEGEVRRDAAAMPKRTVLELGDQKQVREILEERFGIPWEETEGLDMSASDAGANSRLWDHL